MSKAAACFAEAGHCYLCYDRAGSERLPFRFQDFCVVRKDYIVPGQIFCIGNFLGGPVTLVACVHHQLIEQDRPS